MKINQTILAAAAVALATVISTPVTAQERGRMPADSMRHPMHERMQGQQGGMGMSGMMCPMMVQGGMMGPGRMGTILLPPVMGYSQGEEIFFVHTEISDEEMATLMTQMVGSPVIFTPQLADVPAKLRIPVYTFTNGVKDGGPLGYQRDVLPYPPSWKKTGQYSPFRQIHKVTWRDPAQAEVLKSAEAIQQAEARGLVTIEQTPIIINMPMLSWPLGHR
jgi:hypothetical protein